MKNPFVYIDNENSKIVIMLGKTCKEVPFKEIEDQQDFFFELKRRYKNFNFIPHVSEMGKKELANLIDDIQERFEIKKVEEEERTEKLNEQIIEEHGEEELKKIEKSSLIMSVTEKKFSIEDLDLKFSSPGDFYDLNILDKEKVESSTYLNYFIQRGFLVRATPKMISEAKEKYEKERAEISEKRSKVVDRDEANYTTADGKSLGGDVEMKVGEATLIDSSEAVDTSSSSQPAIDLGLGDDIFGGSTLESTDPAIKSIMRGLKK